MISAWLFQIEFDGRSIFNSGWWKRSAEMTAPEQKVLAPTGLPIRQNKVKCRE